MQLAKLALQVPCTTIRNAIWNIHNKLGSCTLKNDVKSTVINNALFCSQDSSYLEGIIENGSIVEFNLLYAASDALSSELFDSFKRWGQIFNVTN